MYGQRQNPWERQRLGYISQALNDMERSYAWGRHSEGNETLGHMSKIAQAEDTIKAINNIPKDMSPGAMRLLGEQIGRMQSGWGRNLNDHYSNSGAAGLDIFQGRRGISAYLGIPYEKLYPIHGGSGVRNPEGQVGIDDAWDDWKKARGIQPGNSQG